MRVTSDDLDALTLGAGQPLEVAERLLHLADHVTADSPVNRAQLLVAASDQYGFAGDLARRVELCELAVAGGGDVPPDARCYLVAALLADRRGAQAAPLIEQLRREDGLHVHAYEFLGETLEGEGRFLEAIELFHLGLQQRGTARYDTAMLLNGRRRCREELGLPPDALDHPALALLRRPQAPPAREVDLVGFLPEHLWSELGAFAVDESFDAQRQRIERQLRSAPSGLPVALISLTQLPEYCRERGLDPSTGQAFRSYLLDQDQAGAGAPWPPGRNEPCWCGADVKYKRCCGRAPS